MALWIECPAHDKEVASLNPSQVIIKTLKIVPSASLSDAQYFMNGDGQLNMQNYQWTEVVAFTALHVEWLRVTETEIGTALCAILV